MIVSLLFICSCTMLFVEAVMLVVYKLTSVILCSSTMPMMLIVLSPLILQNFWTCLTMVCRVNHRVIVFVFNGIL